MTALDEAIEILQAFKEGKVIQWKDVVGNWVDRHSSALLFPDFNHHTYRLKPEPKKLYMIQNKKTGVCWGTFESLCSARADFKLLVDSSTHEIVEFTESGVVK